MKSMLGFWDIGIPKLGTRCLFVRRSSKTSIYRYTDNLSHHLQHCSVLGPMGQHRCQHMDTTRNFNLGQARPDLIMSETTCSYVFHSGEGERERERATRATWNTLGFIVENMNRWKIQSRIWVCGFACRILAVYSCWVKQKLMTRPCQQPWKTDLRQSKLNLPLANQEFKIQARTLMVQDFPSTPSLRHPARRSTRASCCWVPHRWHQAWPSGAQSWDLQPGRDENTKTTQN